MKRRGSLKEILEGDIKKGNPKLEHAYIKYPKEEAIPVSSEETQTGFKYDSKRVLREWKRHNKKQYTTIHTHPYNPEKLAKRAIDEAFPLPSQEDLKGFLYDDNAKTMAIVQQNEKTGKIEGYFILKKTKKTKPLGVPVLDKREARKKLFSQGVIQSFRNVFGLYKKLSGINKETKEFAEVVDAAATLDEPRYIRQILQKLADQYKLKYRFVPAKGYRVAYGIKFKKRSKLEDIVSVVLIFGSVGLFLLGLYLIEPGVTGAVIGASSSSAIGIFLVLISGVLFVVGKDLEERLRQPKAHKYFHKRVQELTKYRGNAWMSQWEYKGIVNELEKSGYDIEHKKGTAAIHLAGRGPRIKHICVQKGKGGRKHIYITPNPYDPRVKQIGFKEKHGKLERVLSKVYYPKHPRSKIVKEKIGIS